MSDDIDADPEITAVVEEARENYSLEDRLRNRGMRTKTIGVYTDEPTAEKHLEIENKINLLNRGATAVQMMIEAAREAGLNDAAEALQPVLEKIVTDPEYRAEEIAALEAERNALANELRSTALVFHLRAVPELIIKDSRRQAKKKLGITGKNVPEAQDEIFDDYVTGFILSAVTEHYVDNVDGSVHNLDPDNARFLADLLPRGEYLKLTGALQEVQFKNVISQSVTDQADFSHSI